MKTKPRPLACCGRYASLRDAREAGHNGDASFQVCRCSLELLAERGALGCDVPGCALPSVVLERQAGPRCWQHVA